MITIVVGGQFGGEGKGKITALLSRLNSYDVVCRTGGVNSSHTVVDGSRKFKLRMIPAASVYNSDADIYYGAGSLIHLATLQSEIAALSIDPVRVHIDPNAGIVTDECVNAQRADRRYDKIGSTMTGTGYATARRAMRTLPLAREFRAELSAAGYNISDVVRLLHEHRVVGRDILIEGHQGTGLSNYHGDYPYTSSRDASASALLSEIGLAWSTDIEVVLAIKAFPTRNHAGKLADELDPETVKRLGIVEFGGGSWGIEDNRRRVGMIDLDLVKRSVVINNPKYIALTGVDYLEKYSEIKYSKFEYADNILSLISSIESHTETKVALTSNGADTNKYKIIDEKIVLHNSKNYTTNEELNININ